MIRILATFAAAACLLCAPASAQSASPIMTHYRAYQAAIERNDLAAAEASAVEALAAAEAANDRRTAALALNLATVRLNQGNAAGALAPARRASQLAEAGAPSVTPTFARIILGRAELGANNRAGADRLVIALPAAVAEGIPSDEIYDAAVELGTWTFREERFADSQLAWSIAQDTAHTSRVSPAFAAGRARVWRAASMALDDLNSNRRRRLSEGPGLESLALLTEANTMLSPLALAEAPNGDVTIGQQAYAEAVAWRTVVRAKLRGDGVEIPESQPAEGDGADGISEIQRTPFQLTRPRCLIALRLDNPNADFYPDDAANSGAIAGLAIRFRINEAGEIIDIRTLARVGHESFDDAVDRMRWRVEKRDDSPLNCRMDMTVITAVSFRIA